MRCAQLSSNESFFFQAEDGIRDGHVTGVQTCALPILKNAIRIFRHNTSKPWLEHLASDKYLSEQKYYDLYEKLLRSEERRVGKECRSRWGRDHEKKKGRDTSGDGVRSGED